MTKWIDYIGVAAAAIIYKPSAWILFVHRTQACRDERDKRDLIGGGVDFGDTLLTTIKKEIKEEVDLTITDDQINYLWHREQFRDHNNQMTHRIWFYYFVILEEDQEATVIETHKFDDIRYFPLDALPSETECHSMNYPTFREFKNQIESLTWKSLAINY